MTDWSLIYRDYAPRAEGLREALCTLGNGYFCTRGAAAEAEADAVHYPGTYLAGTYDRRQTTIAGRVVENEDLVNLPNWLRLGFRFAEEEWFSLAAGEIISYTLALDLKRGILSRTVRFRDRRGRETTVADRRFVHMGQPHLAGVEMAVTAENWSGRIVVRSALEGRIINAGVERYRALNGDHLQPLERGAVDGDGIFLVVQTKQSMVRIAESARTRVFGNGEAPAIKRETIENEGHIAHDISLDVQQGSTVRVEKVVALHSSRDRAIAECGHAARQAIRHAGRFAELVESHSREWSHLWHRFDIVVGSDAAVQRILRLHIFHLLQTLSPHTIDLDVGVPARGWHGEAYRGHVFWDEMFVLPFFTLRTPDVTRALLLYRYRRLDEARYAARQAGYRGAMFPWQSGSDGREESQLVHLNPRSGRWIADNSSLQRHVCAAIAYNVWQYVEATSDTDFMAFYGAEIIFEIARFWASASSYNPQSDRYEILRVMGPDEYHDRYPGAAEPGLDNNAYTNLMAVWVLWRALDVYEMLDEDRKAALCERLALDGEELELWDTISRKMRLVFHDGDIISQFEGYEGLEEFDWDGYRNKYGDIQRLDRILDAEGDSPNRYKLAKQADVLMLFYLFSSEELSGLFQRLGYPFAYETIPRNVDYYLRRTAHGSSLSRIVHAWVLARADRARSWKLFTEALMTDVTDIQQGTTAEGIHLGAMAGTVEIIQRCYTGLEMRGDRLGFHPCLPDDLAAIRQRIRYRRQWLDVKVTRDRLVIRALKGRAAPVTIGFDGETHTLAPGERLALPIRMAC